MVEIDIDDLQIRVYEEGGIWKCRLILQGHKAFDILKENQFADPAKEYRRKMILDIKEW